MPSIDSQSQGPPTSAEPELRVDVQRVLSFFDEKPPGSRGHATAIVSVLGEDLSAASFRHCLLANGATEVNIRCDTVGTGKQLQSPRLDRWIEADLEGGRRVLFQAGDQKLVRPRHRRQDRIAIDADRQEISGLQGLVLEAALALAAAHASTTRTWPKYWSAMKPPS